MRRPSTSKTMNTQKLASSKMIDETKKTVKTKNKDVEDEYISNLMKQVKYLKNQITLLKEKSTATQQKMGLGRLLSRDSKYNVGKDQGKMIDLILDDKTQAFQQEERQNLALKAQQEFLIQIIKDSQANYEKMIKDYENEVKSLHIETKKMKQQRDFQYGQMDKQKNKYTSKLQEIELEKKGEAHIKQKKEFKEKKLNDQLIIEKLELLSKQTYLTSLQQAIKRETERLETDPHYLEQKQEFDNLKNKFQANEVKLSNSTQQCAEMECIDILYNQQKKSEEEEKKTLIDRRLNLNDQLEEQKKITNLKMDRKRKDYKPARVKIQTQRLDTAKNQFLEKKREYEKLNPHLNEVEDQYFHDEYKKMAMEDPLKSLHNVHTQILETQRQTKIHADTKKEKHEDLKTVMNQETDLKIEKDLLNIKLRCQFAYLDAYLKFEQNHNNLKESVKKIGDLGFQFQDKQKENNDKIKLIREFESQFEEVEKDVKRR